MGEVALGVGIAAGAEAGADAAVIGTAAGELGGIAATAGTAGAGELAGTAGLAAGLGGGTALTAAGEGALIGSGLTGAADLSGAAGAAGAGGGIFGTGISTGSSVTDAAAQGVGLNLGEDVVTGKTPTAEGVLQAAGTGAAGGALTGGLGEAATTTPSSGSPALTGGTGAGAAATAGPASLSAGGGDAGLGVGGGDVTAGAPPASGVVQPGATGAPTSTGTGTSAGGDGGGGPTAGPSESGPGPAVNVTQLPAPSAGEGSSIGPGLAGASDLSGAGAPAPADLSISTASSPRAEFGVPYGDASTPTAAPTSESSSSVMRAINDPTWDNIGSALDKNALTVGGIGLQAANFLSQPNAAKKANVAEAAQTDIAAQALAKSKELEGYQASGTLPPGVQGGLDQMRKSADASTASNYAAIGNSGSSAEYQDMAAHRTAEAATAAQIQTQLMSQGIQLAGLANTAYANLYGQAVATDDALQRSIAAFAAALAGSGGGNTLKITQA